MPQNPNLRHVFAVFKRYSYVGRIYTYYCVRTEDRYFSKVFKKKINEGYSLLFYKDEVPNSINVLNCVKDIMRCRYIAYKSRNNVVITPYDFIELVKEFFEGLRK